MAAEPEMPPRQADQEPAQQPEQRLDTASAAERRASRPTLQVVPNGRAQIERQRQERPRKPSGSLARAQARERQRLRLATAMIDCVADGGYRATRVADVIASAGVSRKTFYEHFDNKEDCLLA